MSIFLEIMKEELDRNLYKQNAFLEQLNDLPKGYLSICKIDGKEYVYRKYRQGNKIVSEYVGVVSDNECQKAYKLREEYIKLKKALSDLKIDEKKLRGAIAKYEKL